MADNLRIVNSTNVLKINVHFQLKYQKPTSPQARNAMGKYEFSIFLKCNFNAFPAASGKNRKERTENGYFVYFVRFYRLFRNDFE